MSHPVNSEPKVRFERWIENGVGWSKPPLVLTTGFNRLKPPRSICQNVTNLVNTNLSGRLKILSGRVRGGLR